MNTQDVTTPQEVQQMTEAGEIAVSLLMGLTPTAPLLPADEADQEIRRLRLAYQRLAELYLEFGVGRIGVREQVVRRIYEASLNSLENMQIPNLSR